MPLLTEEELTPPVAAQEAALLGVTLHEADVLAIEASPAGDMVFASGVDSKLVCLRRGRGEHRRVL